MFSKNIEENEFTYEIIKNEIEKKIVFSHNTVGCD